jgi:hypothetical protein
LELDKDRRLVASVPGVMPRSNPVDLTGQHVALGAVGVLDVQFAGNGISDVFDLAAVGAGDWLDALRPAPTGLERVAPDLPAGKVDEVDRRLVRRAGLVGRGKVSVLQTGPVALLVAVSN